MFNDSGVMKSVTFKDLKDQQRLMVGMTKEEIRELTKTIELNKQGLTLEDIKVSQKKWWISKVVWGNEIKSGFTR